MDEDTKIIEALVEALDVFVKHEVSYMTLNNLGDPEKQSRVRLARAALAKAKSI